MTSFAVLLSLALGMPLHAMRVADRVRDDL